LSQACTSASAPVREIAVEQAHLDRVYRRLEEKIHEAEFLVDDAEKRGQVGTPGALAERDAQVHQAAIASHLTPYDPAFQQRMQQMQGALAARGGGAATQQALASVYGMVLRQSMLMSFIDNFRLLAFLCLLCIPAALLFKRVRAKGGPVAAH